MLADFKKANSLHNYVRIAPLRERHAIYRNVTDLSDSRAAWMSSEDMLTSRDSLELNFFLYFLIGLTIFGVTLLITLIRFLAYLKCRMLVSDVTILCV
jgi:hypothetical protein